MGERLSIFFSFQPSVMRVVYILEQVDSAVSVAVVGHCV